MPFNCRRFDELRADYLQYSNQNLDYQAGHAVTMAYVPDAIRNKYGGCSTALLCGARNVGHADTDD